MSGVLGIPILLYGIVGIILFMLVMMGTCFLMKRLFWRKICGMNGWCRCMAMTRNEKEEDTS